MSARSRPAVERFFEKVRKADECWLWTAGSTTAGYGCFRGEGRRLTLAHRWSYEHHVGPIPPGLQIDHLCRVKACVNPDHLEPVTQSENNLRIPRATSCPSGHEYTPENTGHKAWWGRPNGTRFCRECDRDRARDYRAARTGVVA